MRCMRPIPPAISKVPASCVHSKLFRLNQAVSGASGVAGVKYAMELGGYNGGNPRLPLLAIKDTDKQRIKNAAGGAGLL